MLWRAAVGMVFLGAATLAAAGEGARTIEMTVDGMVCGFCMQGIEKKFRTLEATDDIFISLDHHLVAVALKGRRDIADAELKRLLTEAGYTLRAVKRTNQPLDKIRSRLRDS